MSILEHPWGVSAAADHVWSLVVGMRLDAIARRRLMVLQAYIDDSRDGATGNFVLAGYIASAEQWAAFSQEWESMLPNAVKTSKGVHRFKMSEMKHFGKMNDVSLFHNIIMKHVQMSVSVVFNSNELKARVDRLVAEAAHPGYGKINIEIDNMKKKWRDPFFFAFRMLMDGFHQARVAQPDLVPIDGVVDFVFDNDGNEIFIRQIWDEYLANRPEEFRNGYGKKPRFENDEEYLPLQAADFRAWWVRKWVNDFGINEYSNGKYQFEVMNDRQIFHLLLSCDGDQISKTVAESIGISLQAAAERGSPLSVKIDELSRFWPRKPL